MSSFVAVVTGIGGQEKKEMLYESSVCFSLENIGVTFKLNAENKSKVEKNFFFKKQLSI